MYQKTREEILQILKKLYDESFKRELDPIGEKYWMSKIVQEKLTEEQLRKLIIQSQEDIRTKLVSQSLSHNILNDMKTHWNKRAEENSKFYIYTGYKSDEDFWQSGKIEADIVSNYFKTYSTHFNEIEGKVLEIGCGIGRCLIPISENFKEAYGIDVSDKMISIAKKNIGSRKDIQVFENNGQDLNMFEDNFFNLCYSFYTFQHIPSKEIIKNYFSEVSRVLKSKGLFFFQINERILVKDQPTNTWNGVLLSAEEIKQFIDENDFSQIKKVQAEDLMFTQILLQKN